MRYSRCDNEKRWRLSNNVYLAFEAFMVGYYWRQIQGIQRGTFRGRRTWWHSYEHHHQITAARIGIRSMATPCWSLSWACLVDYASSFAFTGSNANAKSFTRSASNTHTFTKPNANATEIRSDFCHHKYNSRYLSRVEAEHALMRKRKMCLSHNQIFCEIRYFFVVILNYGTVWLGLRNGFFMPWLIFI